MIVKASELRRNLFILLDRCLETGEPIEVERKAGALRIAPRHRSAAHLGVEARLGHAALQHRQNVARRQLSHPVP